MQITYIGHATLLIEMQGTRVMTDPNFDPKLGKVLPRVSAPGIPIDQLPTLDAILLTHAHADHLSFDSLDRLPRHIPLYAPPPIARWLRRLGYTQAIDLKPGATARIGPITVHSASAAHRGNRYGYDRWRSDANMYLLVTANESCFFAGDTALVDDSHRLVEEVLWKVHRTLDLALLPIGYAQWWKVNFRRGHLTDEDAMVFFERLHARAFVPYHWGTFRHLTSTAHGAIDRLRVRLESHPLASAVQIIEPGESFHLEAVA